MVPKKSKKHQGVFYQAGHKKAMVEVPRGFSGVPLFAGSGPRINHRFTRQNTTGRCGSAGGETLFLKQVIKSKYKV